MSCAGLLQLLAILLRVRKDVNMDFIIKLPKSQGSNTILVVVDGLNKYAHFLPLSIPFTAKVAAAVFVQEVDWQNIC